MVIVPAVRNVFGGNGSSILTASLLLGMMILPTIISVSESSLNAVPGSYYEGSRAIGETMAVIMVAGNQARIPDSILKGVRTLTANIVIEMGYATDLHREALIATGVVLLFMIAYILVKGVPFLRSELFSWRYPLESEVQFILWSMLGKATGL